MSALLEGAPLADLSLGDVADIGSLVATVGALVGLAFVVLQLRSAALAARAQATILFQERFRASRPARSEVLADFPIHTSLAPLVAVSGGPPVRTWDRLEDLTQTEREAADAVVSALNDVAQYVVDGLELRSALQQYHTIFLRLGALLTPYLEQRNEPLAGRSQARYGRRVPVLFNAALAYHRCSPRHRGREVALLRPTPSASGDEVRLVLLDGAGAGLSQFVSFADAPQERLDLDDARLSQVIRAAQAKLRR